MPRTACIEPLEQRTLLAAIKILPLGDSITSGSGDNQNDIAGATGPRYEVTQTAGGYRRFLKYYFAQAGYEVDYVGNVRHTVAPDAANARDPLYNVDGVNRIAASSLVDDAESAGFPGYPIVNDASPGTAQIAGPLTAAAMATRPDVVLLHAGTNDINSTSDVAKQVRDFGLLLDQIFAIAPGVKVIVAPLIPKQGLLNIDKFNRGIHDLVRASALAGRGVVWAGAMASALAQDATGVPDFAPDRIHPNLIGYAKMAKTFFDAFVAAPEQLAAPRTFDFADGRLYKSNFYTGYGRTVQPSGAGDGILRFTDPSPSSYRYGAALYDPADTGTNLFADSVITAEFRTSTGNSTFGVYLRVGSNDAGGYLGRAVVDSSGATDLLGIYKNASAATPSVLPPESARAAGTALAANTWYTMQFSAVDTADGKGVALALSVYPRGTTGGTPLLHTAWTDVTAPNRAPGQVGLRFGYGPPNSRVDADNLRIVPAAATNTALRGLTAASAPRVATAATGNLRYVWADQPGESGYDIDWPTAAGGVWSSIAPRAKRLFA
jgi:hypothetical protein